MPMLSANDPYANSGSPRAVLAAAAQAIRECLPATLVVVMDTEGSTYAKAGALAWFGAGRQLGWLSGGCLEPEITRRAAIVADTGACDAMDIDTRDDEDFFSGAAIGCRGRLRLLLLPLSQLPHGDEVIDAWCRGDGALQMRMDDEGKLCWQVAAMTQSWTLPKVPTEVDAVSIAGAVELLPPPRLLMFGTGPEAPVLIPQLRALGWHVAAVESRVRWRAHLQLADEQFTEAPELIAAQSRSKTFDAALVMHHHFDLDRQALSGLAETDIGFIGLLGPRRRRDDLFKLLTAPMRDALQPRLHAPVGLDLGGFGVEAIALSIAAQLHSVLHGRR